MEPASSVKNLKTSRSWGETTDFERTPKKRRRDTEESPQKRLKLNHLPCLEQDIHYQKQKREIEDTLLHPRFWESPDNPKSKIVFAQCLIEKGSQKDLKIAYDTLLPIVEQNL